MKKKSVNDDAALLEKAIKPAEELITYGFLQVNTRLTQIEKELAEIKELLK